MKRTTVAVAWCFEESGLRRDIKQRVLNQCHNEGPEVFTDPLVSPTGFPFKVLQLEDSLANDIANQQRQRLCDLGFLRQAYQTPEEKLGWRCPGEPINAYLRKGGAIEDTVGRKCVCNGLTGNVGLEQVRRNGERELPLVTCGNDVRHIRRFLKTPETKSYSAADVVANLLAGDSSGVAARCEVAHNN